MLWSILFSVVKTIIISTELVIHLFLTDRFQMFLYLSYVCSSCCNFISYFFQSTPFASKVSFAFTFKFSHSILHPSSDLKQKKSQLQSQRPTLFNFQIHYTLTTTVPVYLCACYPLLNQFLFPTCSYMLRGRSLLYIGFRQCCTLWNCVARLEQCTLSHSSSLTTF